MAGKEELAKRWSIGGALLAAVAASSCCVGPLLLIALGVGGAGAAATLGGYRPYLLAFAALLLAVGFFVTYRWPRVGDGDTCGCARSTTRVAGGTR